MHESISANAPPYSQRFQETTEALVQLLQIDLTLALELSRSIEICQLEFGEAISTDSFYLTESGRVRLVSFDQQQHDVSVGTVGAGETFGQDTTFYKTALYYRAIAAKNTQLIQVKNLALWLDRLPQWQQIWIDQAITRERLIFLKTQTDFGASLPRNQSVTSAQLRQLVSLLVEISIDAGTLIAQSEANQGYCWLRSGEIEAPYETLHTWSTLALSTEWRAKTDLRVYQLPSTDWETASAIAPAVKSLLSPESTLKPPRATTEKLQALSMIKR